VTAALALHTCDQLNDTDRAAAISSSLQDANIQPIRDSELLLWLAHRHKTTADSSVDETDVQADIEESEQTASDSSHKSSDDNTQQYSADSCSATASSSVSNDVVVVTHTKAATAGTAT
jgi:hypothetical protein